MTPSRTSGGATLVAALLAASAAGALSASSVAAQQTALNTSAPSAASQAAAIAKARADSARLPYTRADIDFMTGMIGHHAQAIVMSKWAPSHGASPEVRTLAARIINAQQDEIRTMQQWLRDRQLPAPDGHSGMSMSGMSDMGGMKSEPLMPGMLTDAQLKELDAARGPAFDRLFLQDMIQHHEGAITMVKQLFDSYGAGQDEIVFKFATDANVDQTTEITRMQRMLVAEMFGSAPQP
jgi:uncharacterized protein (DUF305 family)